MTTTAYSDAIFLPGREVENSWGAWPLPPAGPAVCVGNGPSLAPADLTEVQLLNLTSFGCNWIHRIYDKTVWRPTYWVATDIPDNRWVAWHVAQGYECFLTSNRIDKVEQYRPPWRFKGAENVHYLPTCEHHWKRYDNPDRPKRLHLPRVCMYGSSGLAAIQLAILFGHNPILLLGHDGGLVPRPRPVHEKPAADPNHFDAEYNTEQDITAGLAERWTRTWGDAHRLVAEAADELGVKIYNATRGGTLETYERIDFDRIQEVL